MKLFLSEYLKYNVYRLKSAMVKGHWKITYRKFQMKYFITLLNPLICNINYVWKTVWTGKIICLNIYKNAFNIVHQNNFLNKHNIYCDLKYEHIFCDTLYILKKIITSFSLSSTTKSFNSLKEFIKITNIEKNFIIYSILNKLTRIKTFK